MFKALQFITTSGDKLQSSLPFCDQYKILFKMLFSV